MSAHHQKGLYGRVVRSQTQGSFKRKEKKISRAQQPDCSSEPKLTAKNALVACWQVSNGSFEDKPRPEI